MKISFVIPQWNRSDLLHELLVSISRQSLARSAEIEVIVVDNGSLDDSIDVAYRTGAKVIALETNRGVSYALNRGIEAASGEWVVLVNNDVELAPTWLSALLAKARMTGAWFATGKTLDKTDHQKIDGAGDAICRGGASWRLGHGRADSPLFCQARKTYFPSATAALFRRELFDRVGLFDESFFAYLEDVDLGLRCAIAGLEGIYVPEALAYHHGSATARAWSPRMVEWMTSHQLFLIAKFYPGRMLRQQLWRITAAQLLWLAMSARRGQTKAWIRGAARGLRRFRPMRRESDNLRSNSLPLEIALTAAESDIARIQKASGWDGYWKWYFRLTGMPPEGPA
jgi:hypothetical protein